MIKQFIFKFKANNPINNFKNLNKKIFKSIDGSGKILLEFNNWHPLHISFAYLANFLAENLKASIIAYPGYKLIVENLDNSFTKKIKFYLGKKLWLKTFGIYNSFGVNDIINLKIDKTIEKKALKKFHKIKKKIKTRRDILNIKLENIEIGDLVYDTYLAKKKIPTIDPAEIEFQNFLQDTIKYFYFWKKYIENNNVKAIITSHSTYTIAIPLRIALKANIPSFVCKPSDIYRLTKKKYLCETEFVDFRKKFNSLSQNEKSIGLKEAKRRIKLRLEGKIGVDMGYSSKSSFSQRKYSKKILKKNNKIKVLIATHCFLDAPNAIGKLLFSDFFEWLEFLGNFSKKTDYEWYIKSHPDFKVESYKILNKLLKKFPHIKLISPSTSHHQLKKEGINFALTCYGTIGFEYAMLGIPVINASVNNPHINYNFNFHPRNKKEYINLLKNLKKIKLKINKKEIYEYYFMMHIFYTKNWLLNDLAKIEKKAGGFRKIYNEKIYDLFIKEFNTNKHNRILKIIDNFIKSKEFRLSYKTANFTIQDEIRKGRNIN